MQRMSCPDSGSPYVHSDKRLCMFSAISQVLPFVLFRITAILRDILPKFSLCQKRHVLSLVGICSHGSEGMGPSMFKSPVLVSPLSSCKSHNSYTCRIGYIAWPTPGWPTPEEPIMLSSLSFLTCPIGTYPTVLPHLEETGPMVLQSPGGKPGPLA